MSIEELIIELKPSVLLLRSGTGSGTGFAISKAGHIITCSHVANTNDISVTSTEGNHWKVPVMARDPLCDLAIIKTTDDCGFSPLCFADPASIAEGQTVFALGYPLSIGFTVTRGIVSNRSRILDGVNFVQTDVPINPGNSGGPIVNERGEVVGISNKTISKTHGIGFGVAVGHAIAFAATLRVVVKCATAFPFSES